jgi:hypothetical protein
MGLALLLIAPWGLLAVIWAGRGTLRDVERVWSRLAAARGDRHHHCKPGPWGDLKCVRIAIEPPPEFLFLEQMHQLPPGWFFRASSREELAAWLARAGLLLFLRNPGRLVHSAVFIADDLVFTKNGPDAVQPWLLMRINDLTEGYARTHGQFMKERKSRKERAQRRRCDADNPVCRRCERNCPITRQTGLSASPTRRASSQLLQIMNWPWPARMSLREGLTWGIGGCEKTEHEHEHTRHLCKPVGRPSSGRRAGPGPGRDHPRARRRAARAVRPRAQ